MKFISATSFTYALLAVALTGVSAAPNRKYGRRYNYEVRSDLGEVTAAVETTLTGTQTTATGTETAVVTATDTKMGDDPTATDMDGESGGGVHHPVKSVLERLWERYPELNGLQICSEDENSKVDHPHEQYSRRRRRSRRSYVRRDSNVDTSEEEEDGGKPSMWDRLKLKCIPRRLARPFLSKEKGIPCTHTRGEGEATETGILEKVTATATPTAAV